jgi:hypothetical protein
MSTQPEEVPYGDGTAWKAPDGTLWASREALDAELARRPERAAEEADLIAREGDRLDPCGYCGLTTRSLREWATGVACTRCGGTWTRPPVISEEEDDAEPDEPWAEEAEQERQQAMAQDRIEQGDIKPPPWAQGYSPYPAEPYYQPPTGPLDSIATALADIAASLRKLSGRP